MAISSINIKLATIFVFFHNTREAIVSYLISDSRRNEYDKTGDEAYNYYLYLLKEASANYTKRTKQKIQTDEKKFLWEAVINLNHNHELKDVRKLGKVLESIYGWQPIQMVIHRDEGHIDNETDEIIYNYHAHIVFFMLNKEGIYSFKKRDFGVKRMVELQTTVANVLNMERGISKKTTKRERLEHRQYRQMAQKIAQIQKKLNQLGAAYSEEINQNSHLQKKIVNNKKHIDNMKSVIQKLEGQVYSKKWTRDKTGKIIKIKNADLVTYLEKQNKNLEKTLQQQKHKFKMLNDSWIADFENNEMLMRNHAKEIERLKEYYKDKNSVKISELEEWKDNVQRILVNMKTNGLLFNSSLDHYITFPDNTDNLNMEQNFNKI